MALYEPLRDAFNEMNRMFIDRQTWQAEHERRAENDAWNRQVQEKQMQTQAMQDEILAVKAAKAKQQTTPRDFSVYNLGDPDNIREVMEDPNAVEMMERSVSDLLPGAKFSPADGGFVDEAGQRLQMNNLQAQDRAMAFYGILDMHVKKPEQVALNLVDLVSEKKAKMAERKAYAPDSRFTAKVGEIDTKLAGLNKEIADHQSFLDPTTGKLSKHHLQKMDHFSKRARWATSRDAPELAANFMKQAEWHWNSYNLAEKAKLKPSKTGLKVIEFFATEDGAINPITGKEMKKNEAFKKEVDPRDGVPIYDKFSTSKVDKGATDGTAMAATDRRYKVGQDIVQKAALPQGMIIKHDEFKASFRDAADKQYANLVDEFKPDSIQAYRAIGHLALEQTVRKHESFQKEWKQLDEAKENPDETFTVTIEGEEFKLTAEEMAEEVKNWNNNVLDDLGYIPDWEIETRQKRKRTK